MGTLASQAEIGVWIGASTGGASARVRGYDPWKKIEIAYAKTCNLEHFGQEMARNNAVHNAFINTLTMGTASPSN